jgi:hypothetical protein
MSNQMRRFVQTAVAAGVGGLLLYSGVQHLKNPLALLISVVRYHLLPHSLAAAAATALPYAEVALGSLLLVSHERRMALALSAALFLGFAVAQAYAFASGFDIACGCFGQSFEGKVSIASIAFVATLSMTSLLACFVYRRNALQHDTVHSNH